MDFKILAHFYGLKTKASLHKEAESLLAEKYVGKFIRSHIDIFNFKDS